MSEHTYADLRADTARGLASFALLDAVEPWPDHLLSQVVARTLFNVTTNAVAITVIK